METACQWHGDTALPFAGEEEGGSISRSIVRERTREKRLDDAKNYTVDLEQ